MAEYSAENIKHLDTRTAFRTQINVYLGSNDDDGIYQALKEVINNSTDEALAGYGSIVTINVSEKLNQIKIRDEGRGIPFLVKDGHNTLVSVCTEAHTGGKFDKGAYKNSSGLHGLGLTAVCMSSKNFQITSFRNGTAATAIFSKGEVISYKEQETSEQNGTFVIFTPDKEVFKNMSKGFSYKRVCSDIQNIAFLNKGIHFIVINDETNEKYDYYSENGIADFITQKAPEPLMSKPIIISKKDSTDEVEVAFIWTKNTSQSYVFVNGLFCNEGGQPCTGAKRALTSTIKRLSGKDFEPELIRKGFVYAVNCKVANPQFSNQTKSKVNNQNLATLTGQCIREGLEQFSNSNEFKAIIEMIGKVQRAENAATRAREAVLNHTKEMNTIKKQKLAFIEKLKDCENLGQDSILLCVEGNSAASMVAKARDTKKFGLLALRGKLINCLSNPEEKYLVNEEIKLLLYAMGIDINHYNSSKLRYGKIGICVDGDEDGNHISLLILSALAVLCPQIIKENRVCWLRAPLFTEIKGKQHYYYYSEEEKNLKQHGGEIVPLKGLGSMNPQEMEESMFSNNQKLDILEYTPEALELLQNLMGNDVTFRKEFIFNNIDFSKYTDI